MLSSNPHMKVAGFFIWLALVAAIAIALANQQRFFAISRHPIATIIEKKGIVTSRRENLARWQDVQLKDPLFDGDLIATGGASRTRVGFDGGRYISVAEDTQIQVTAIQQSTSGNAYFVTLVRGSLIANIPASCKVCAPIIIRSGGETFNITAGKMLGLSKVMGRKLVTFDPKGSKPIVPEN